MPWRIVTYRLAADPSRHRVGIWRELRRVGAVALQTATWAVPSGDRFDQGLAKTRRLVERANGQLLVLDLDPGSAGLGELERLYTSEREKEWLELWAECDRAADDLGGAPSRGRPTLAELDEQGERLERLRRCARELRARDLFGAPSAPAAELRLKRLAALVDDVAGRLDEAARP